MLPRHWVHQDSTSGDKSGLPALVCFGPAIALEAVEEQLAFDRQGLGALGRQGWPSQPAIEGAGINAGPVHAGGVHGLVCLESSLCPLRDINLDPAMQLCALHVPQDAPLAPAIECLVGCVPLLPPPQLLEAVLDDFGLPPSTEEGLGQVSQVLQDGLLGQVVGAASKDPNFCHQS
eukprot:4501355-Lingulodinium_polyedra.AAC.1